MRERMRALTFEVICRAVFGVTEPERVERLRAALAADHGCGLVHLLRPGVAARSRSRPAKPVGPHAAAARPRRRPALRGDRTAPRRQSDLEERTDVLSLLVRARDEDGQPMSDHELRDELMTMLAAGHETTATGLAFAFDLLLHNPAALERLREELAGGDDAYLEAVVTETLRIRPVIDAAERTLPEAARDRRLRAARRDPRLPGDRARCTTARTFTPSPTASAPTLPRRQRRVLRLASLRRRHPPLHRRRPRPGRDGRGAPHRSDQGDARGPGFPARSGGHPRDHHDPEARDPGPGRVEALDQEYSSQASREFIGSSARPPRYHLPLQISKCRWQPLALPVSPTPPTHWPPVTLVPLGRPGLRRCM